jgi:hypothetical protein
MMALMMFNRARFTNKPAEAEIYRQWLAASLDEARPKVATRIVALCGAKGVRRRSRRSIQRVSTLESQKWR